MRHRCGRWLCRLHRWKRRLRHSPIPRPRQSGEPWSTWWAFTQQAAMEPCLPLTRVWAAGSACKGDAGARSCAEPTACGGIRRPWQRRPLVPMVSSTSPLPRSRVASTSGEKVWPSVPVRVANLVRYRPRDLVSRKASRPTPSGRLWALAATRQSRLATTSAFPCTWMCWLRYGVPNSCSRTSHRWSSRPPPSGSA